jgi:hypothetical protein
MMLLSAGPWYGRGTRGINVPLTVVAPVVAFGTVSPSTAAPCDQKKKAAEDAISKLQGLYDGDKEAPLIAQVSPRIHRRVVKHAAAACTSHQRNVT